MTGNKRDIHEELHCTFCSISKYLSTMGIGRISSSSSYNMFGAII